VSNLLRSALGLFWDQLQDFAAPYPPAGKGEILSRQERRRRYQAARRDAARLEVQRQAKQHERNIQLLKLYGDIAPISVGAGVFVAVVIAIATHLTNTAWAYAISVEREGYPPLWLWAGLGVSIATAGIMYARRK
jgi:hypothetical protein